MTMSKDQISEVNTALNRAADIIQELVNPDDHEDSDTVWMNDTLNLLVNSAGYLLEHPGADLNEVIVKCYGVNVEPVVFYGMPDDRKPAKGSPEWDAAVIEEVKGWLA